MLWDLNTRVIWPMVSGGYLYSEPVLLKARERIVFLMIAWH